MCVIMVCCFRPPGAGPKKLEILQELCGQDESGLPLLGWRFWASGWARAWCAPGCALPREGCSGCRPASCRFAGWRLACLPLLGPIGHSFLRPTGQPILRPTGPRAHKSKKILYKSTKYVAMAGRKLFRFGSGGASCWLQMPGSVGAGNWQTFVQAITYGVGFVPACGRWSAGWASPGERCCCLMPVGGAGMAPCGVCSAIVAAVRHGGRLFLDLRPHRAISPFCFETF